ncbi:MAG: hypothetical protein QMD04_02825 [Anaerolineales bacterium]|nr:hypothetical protein [Anaerolineales bacterium]
MKTFLPSRCFARDLKWIIPASLGVGAFLSALDGGTWWIGWLAYSFILALGLSALAALWRRAGAGRTLAWMLLLTLFLRLGLGIALTYILPVAGYPTDVQQAGYVFRDAFTRDTQAWSLANSNHPVLSSFAKSYRVGAAHSADQYGGLLALSALVYRYLSPDIHRPWLIILLAALVAAIGVALTWKAARQAWGASVGAFAAWIMALYPESILLGSSQMREPFLITFIAMLFLGAVTWQARRRTAIAWMAGGLAGMLLFSPGVAIFALLVTGGFLWLRRGVHISWRLALAVPGVGIAAVLLLWLGLARGSLAGASLFETLANWLGYSAQWDLYLTQRASDGLQPLFDALPKFLHLPLVTAYGLFQPVLPAAIADPAPWPWYTLAIFRALGWYALLPLLIFALIASWKVAPKNERRAWLWLWLATWGWIVLSSARAGGDQWDNPRYRVILILFQAALAAGAWTYWRAARSPWFGRILAVEGVFLVLFGYWYADRYTDWPLWSLSFLQVVLGIAFIGFLILLGGWGWDRREKRKKLVE